MLRFVRLMCVVIGRLRFVGGRSPLAGVNSAISSRARSIVPDFAGQPTSKPQWWIRWKPWGRTWSTKRWMYSYGQSAHGLVVLWSLAAMVFDAECYAFSIGAYQPAVGDGDAVRVAREIGQRLLGSAKRGAWLVVLVCVVEGLKIRLERERTGFH